MQAGGWLLKPGLVPIDDVTIKRNQTAVYVALDALIRQGGGLAVGQDKRIYVDFSLMPTDAFEDLLKSIRVPVWLTGNKNFYVNGEVGSDTLDSGRGESKEKPFKTIQACVDYVSANYNVQGYTATIRIAAGTYTESLKLGNFSRTTGSIRLCCDGDARSVTIASQDSVFSVTDGNWIVEGLNLTLSVAAANDGVSRFYACAGVNGGKLSIRGCASTATFTGDAPTSGSATIRVFSSRITGEVELVPTSVQNEIIYHRGAATALIVFYCESGGRITFLGTNNSGYASNISAYGECGIFAYSGDASISRNTGYTYQSSFSVPSSQTATGKRYQVTNRGFIGTGGAGPDFFPGDQAGTADASTYSVYN